MHPRPWRVILLPGAVLPAEAAYAPLLAELGRSVDARLKDLEVYATDAPPPDYSLATEVDGIARVADEAGFERFHLIGYSGGGASSLAFAASSPERLLSLALMEPAFAGWQAMTVPERSHMERFRPILDLDDAKMFAEFQRLQVAPDVELVPPPSGSPPAWMAKRPAGIRAFTRAFFSSDINLDALGRFDRPVWIGYGGRSNHDHFGLMADRLAATFPDITVEVFADRHHFDPPHRIEPARVAASLRALWTRAEPQPLDTGASARSRRVSDRGRR